MIWSIAAFCGLWKDDMKTFRSHPSIRRAIDRTQSASVRAKQIDAHMQICDLAPWQDYVGFLSRICVNNCEKHHFMSSPHMVGRSAFFGRTTSFSLFRGHRSGTDTDAAR
jgi:hypothetical protein